ncbi:UbiA family prenyltransferase [uncultured Roseobacter sp.]|uniref:UbiA family prenyltransferase n=1 Tax=uncultured Roseobacter sp. TaxID=114847 RepID=UPI002614F18D|nr:UbiA family prenyltransferase [uncultured Roseobacter sp.]
MITTFLRLGRISNLPTVWTNALAAIVLVSVPKPVESPVLSFLAAGVALSFFYVGGMFLNDAFDAEYDKAKRADRPIPNGEVSAQSVFAWGFGFLGVGLALGATFGGRSAVVAVALAVAIILYDWLHKRVSFGPVIMATTRFLSYALAAMMAAGTMETTALLPALGLFAYIIGLTYAAKQEEYDTIGSAWPLAVLAVPVLLIITAAVSTPLVISFAALFIAMLAQALWRLFRRQPGDVPIAVISMIAGISLYDATFIASAGQISLAVFAASFFVLTLFLQRVARGT